MTIGSGCSRKLKPLHEPTFNKQFCGSVSIRRGGGGSTASRNNVLEPGVLRMRYVALAVVTVNVGIRAVRQIQNTIIEQLFIQLTRGRVEDAHVGSFIHSYAYRFSASSSCPRILPHEAGKKCHSHNSILKRNYKLTELDNRQSAWYLGLKRKQALATSSFSPTSWLARMSLPNIN